MNSSSSGAGLTGDNPQPEKHRYLGIDITTLGREQFLNTIFDFLAGRGQLTVSFLNPFYARLARRDPQLRSHMNAFDLLQPDGWGVVYGARLAGIRVPERLAIEDVEVQLFQHLERAGMSVFLFGSEPGMAERAHATLRQHFPRLQIAGCMHGWLDVLRGHPGWFEREDDDQIIETINASGATMLFVGLPTPLQQRWVQDNAARLGTPVVMTVGAYLDHLAEGIGYFPGWMLALRLGWLYRVVREPLRLWRRYSLGSLEYAYLALGEALRHYAARLRARHARPRCGRDARV